MTEWIYALGLSGSQWGIACLCGVLIGVAKTGMAGLGLIVVVVAAALFGGKASTGIMLPLLCVADIFAVAYYNRHADFKLIIRLIPWVLAGMATGILAGNIISDRVFIITIGIIVFVCIALMTLMNSSFQKADWSGYWWLALPTGMAGGFATMIGNAAGPLIALYLLVMKFPKNELIGTGAWFFLVINMLKLPMHVFFWKTISIQTLLFDITVIPSIIIGVILGIFLVKKISNKGYTVFIQVTTAISAMVLIIKNI